MPESSHGNNTQPTGAAPDPAPSCGHRCNKRSGRGPRGSNMRHERFEGKCDSLRGHIYDIGQGSSKLGETFQKTTREIAEYIGREFDKGGEFRTGLVMMQLPELIEPQPPKKP